MSEFAANVGMLLKQKPGQIVSIAPDATVYDAIERMAEREVGAVLVMEEGKLAGILSERDYARKVILQGRSSRETEVSEIMTSPVMTVSERCTVGECMQIMTERRIRHLPVVEGAGVVGMISIGDLVNWVIKEQQSTIRHLEAYICGATTP